MSNQQKEICLQETYAPHSQCFGCGPKNEKGLKIRSFVTKEESRHTASSEPQAVIATFKPELHHEAFPGILNGGIIGSILDCHSNWAAAWYLMQQQTLTTPPCTVTAEYKIKLLRPTRSDKVLTLTAYPTEIKEDRVWIKANLSDEDKVCATCEGLFVAVKPGHPAYHRW
jgi:acyl-coenzyme A thioesterase PaaI-like protein